MTEQSRKREIKFSNKNEALSDNLLRQQPIDVEYKVKEVKVKFFKDGEFIEDLTVKPLGPSLNEFWVAFKKEWTDYCRI